MAAANPGSVQQDDAGRAGRHPPAPGRDHGHVHGDRARLPDARRVRIRRRPDFTKLFGGEQTPEQYEAWEEARAETARLAWEPYMFNPSLPHLLEGIDGLPTLLVWGKQDPMVPLSAAEVYQRSIKGSKVVTIDNCGHYPGVEQPAEFLKQVQRVPGLSVRSSSMHIMWFTERAYHYVPEDEVLKLRSFLRRAEQVLRSAKRRAAAQPVPRREDLFRRARHVRRRDAQRASRHAVLHGRGDGCRGGGARQVHQESQDRAARQSAADGRQSAAPGRRAGDDRPDLGRAAGARMGPRRGQRAARQQRQPGLQPRILRGSARPRDHGLDHGPARFAGRASISISVS